MQNCGFIEHAGRPAFTTVSVISLDMNYQRDLPPQGDQTNDAKHGVLCLTSTGLDAYANDRRCTSALLPS